MVRYGLTRRQEKASRQRRPEGRAEANSRRERPRRHGSKQTKRSKRPRLPFVRHVRAKQAKRTLLQCTGIIPLQELAIWATDMGAGSYNDLCVRGYMFGSLIAHYHDRHEAQAALARYCELVCESKLSPTMKHEILMTAKLSFNDYTVEDFVDEGLTEAEYDAIHRYLQADTMQRPQLASDLPDSQEEAIMRYMEHDQFWCLAYDYLQDLAEIVDEHLAEYGI